jgi:hypothetical protein
MVGSLVLEVFLVNKLAMLLLASKLASKQDRGATVPMAEITQCCGCCREDGSEC